MAIREFPKLVAQVAAFARRTTWLLALAFTAPAVAADATEVPFVRLFDMAPKRHTAEQFSHVCYWHLADIWAASENVRFRG